MAHHQRHGEALKDFHFASEEGAWPGVRGAWRQRTWGSGWLVSVPLAQ